MTDSRLSDLTDEIVETTLQSAQPCAMRGGTKRISASPETVERDLARFVLSLIEVLRQLIERQALRRVDGGSLSEDQIERLGLTLLKLEARMEELKRTFGLTDADLRLDIGDVIESDERDFPGSMDRF